MRSPLPRSRWPAHSVRRECAPLIRGRWLRAMAVALAAASASCRNDAPDPRVTSQTPHVTGTNRVTVAGGRTDDVNHDVGPEQTGPSEMGLGEMGLGEMGLGEMESIEANPLGGCVACHVDVEDELNKSIHLVEEVGCVECHGPSDGHVRDENNEVPPDEVFARKDVDRLCGECHKCSRPKVEPPPPDHKVCTDCHQPHSLALAGGGQQ